MWCTKISFDNFLHKKILHVFILQQKYWCRILQPHFFFWSEIIKGNFCTSHWTWTCPPNSWRNLFCMIGHQIHQLLHMQRVCFLFFWLDSGYVSDWTVILSKQSWYHHFEKLFPCWIKYYHWKNHFVCCKYKSIILIHIHDTQQQNPLERLSATWCLRL